VLARNLHLNEDLTEAIALAHDLGHTPFGHAGQDELNACMRAFAPEAGGFEHNLQSLRVIDELEERYASFNGLNLCFETREGVLKHCSMKHAKQLGDVGQRFLDRTQPSLEAQLANLADEIAYNNHDIDDGLRSGLLTIEQLQTVPIFARHFATTLHKWPALNERRVVAETIRSMINTLITDVAQTTQANLIVAAPADADAARRCQPLVAFSPGLRAEADTLKKFLLENLYRHYKVMRMTNKARRIVRELFDAFVHESRLLPPDYRHEQAAAQARAIADYIAGMTDRYAIREHHRLFRMGSQFD
jgi:dGTPase